MWWLIMSPCDSGALAKEVEVRRIRSSGAMARRSAHMVLAALLVASIVLSLPAFSYSGEPRFNRIPRQNVLAMSIHAFQYSSSCELPLQLDISHVALVAPGWSVWSQLQQWQLDRSRSQCSCKLLPLAMAHLILVSKKLAMAAVQLALKLHVDVQQSFETKGFTSWCMCARSQGLRNDDGFHRAQATRCEFW